MIKINKLRLKYNLTLKKLGNKIGVSAQTIFNWENEITIPSLFYLIKLASFFNISIDYLVGYRCNNFRDLVINEISQIDGAELKQFIIEFLRKQRTKVK